MKNGGNLLGICHYLVVLFHCLKCECELFRIFVSASKSRNKLKMLTWFNIRVQSF